MPAITYLNRLRNYLGRGWHKRPAKCQSRPGIEALENRMLLSTLFIDGSNNATYNGNSALFGDTLTMSEKTVLTFFGRIAERTFTDSADTINVTGPGAGSTTGSGTHTVTWTTFFGSGSIQVFANAFSTLVTLQSNDVSVHVTENSGSELTVDIGNSTNGVQSILGAVGVDQRIDTSTNVAVDDSADSGVLTKATFNGGYLTGLAPAPIHVGGNIAGALNLNILGGQGLSPFANVFTITNTPLNNSAESSSVTLYTGKYGAEVNVLGTSGPLTINNNYASGFDSVTLGNTYGNTGGTLTNFFGAVNVYGAGATDLIVDDSGDTTSHSAVDLTATSLTGLSPAAIQWIPSTAATGGVIFLAVDGGAGNATYNVLDTPQLHDNVDLVTGTGLAYVYVDATSSSELDLYNNGGTDYVFVGNGTLAGISGNVSVSGSGSTYLYAEDQSDTTSRTVSLTDGLLSGFSTGSISAGPGVKFLVINGSAAASTYTVNNTPYATFTTYLDLGSSGTDLVFVTGTTGSLYIYNGTSAHAYVYVETGLSASSINGLVDVDGTGDNYLYVEDFNTSAARTALLTGTSLTGLSAGAIEWTPTSSPTGGLTSLEIYGSAANTTFDVVSIPSLYYGTALVGGRGTNTLIGPNTTNTWNITGADAGNLNVRLGFTGIADLIGGTGVDTFRFTAAASHVASINGGGAPAGQGDWLDYTAFPSAVTVDLRSTTVNGVKPNSATGVTGTVRNIQNVFGGNFGNTLIGDAQGNILIGGAGADHIFGGTGPSLLVGGKGNDTIVGGSGGDILIGGFTTFDQAHNEAALMSILAEWQSGKAYTTRVADLKFGGGLNGSNRLVLGLTVIDDGGADSLTGGSHIPGALDWFFAGLHDTIHNYESGEQIN
jgi:hypothetical protein